MNATELALVKEALTLAGNALTQLETVGNDRVKHIASMLAAVVHFGEMIVGLGV